MRRTKTLARQIVLTGSSTLQEACILERILLFVGRGHFLFISAVSKAWLEAYRPVPAPARSTWDDTPKCSSCMTLGSAVFGSVSRVRLAHTYGFRLDEYNWNLRRLAGRYGSIDVLAAVHELGMPLSASDDILRGAAISGCLQKLQALCEQYKAQQLPADISNHAARSGNVAMLQWLKEKQCAFSSATSEHAAYYGHLDCVKYLRACGCDWSSYTCDAAAEHGYLDIVQWLLENDCQWSGGSTACSAAGSGSTELMLYLLQQGIACDADVMCCAAQKGHLAVCQLLHEDQCPWDESSTEAAAEGGHTDTLNWLIQNGCPWSIQEVCACAAQSGSVDTMSYVLQLPGVSTAAQLTHMLNAAGAKDQLISVQWLRAQQSAEWPTVLQYEGVSWTGTALAWARQQGCTSPTV
jgi:Ankyrin repeats (3 copies)